ncbi:hypothetical protein PCI56_17345 [Plesiomonas shigelloides subsp. oncorhynchi]|nr:hypothetical protein [Plesiomonas shigelloides]
MDAFIQLMAGAIDAKSAYTGGHCQRVPELTEMLAEAAVEAKTGPFAEFSLSADEREELHIASWLHDCGKVTTPEFVVDKATKLETIYDRLHEIRMRIEVLKRDAKIHALEQQLQGLDPSSVEQQYQTTIVQLDEDFRFIATCNIGGEFMSDEHLQRLQQIAERRWLRTLDDRIGVSHEELQRKTAPQRQHCRFGSRYWPTAMITCSRVKPAISYRKAMALICRHRIICITVASCITSVFAVAR